MSRRRFLAAGTLALGGAVAAAAYHINTHNESEQLVIEKVTLPIKGLAAAFDGFRIALLGDFHLRPYTQPPLVRQAVELTNALQPDLVVLVGDYVWRDVDAIFELAPILAGLNAKHGVFAAMGNHDLWTNVAVVTQGLHEAGLPTLINQGLPITQGSGTLYLAGLDDGWSGKPDLEAALDQSPRGAPVVLLLHEPDLADTYARDPRIALQVSGHTHGGQVRFPRLGGALVLPYLGRKYDMGLYKVRNMWLYTNRGIGVTNEPVRYNCPPEITEITLVGA
ncbi:MAG: metallophosphoesterase [Anaerolineales bacterium]|nr:metallophosphoesterase [Anaerolineales bacterium]